MPGKAAFGTTITGPGGAIANVTTISGGGITLDTEDVTSHDSTDSFEEAVATILRSPEWTLEINYDPTEATHKNTANGLLALLIARAPVAWTLGGPLGAWSFSGFVTSFEPSAPHDGKLTAACKLKPTGSMTLA